MAVRRGNHVLVINAAQNFCAAQRYDLLSNLMLSIFTNSWGHFSTKAIYREADYMVNDQ